MKLRRRQGMTIPEVLLTCIILLLLSGMIIDILIPAGNLLAEASVKTELQQLAQLSVNQMVASLGQTPAGGVSLVPDSVNATTMVVPANTTMIMSTNPIISVDGTGSPVYDSNITIFWSDPATGNLNRMLSNSPAITFSAYKSVAVNPVILTTLIASPNNTLRRLAHHVQSFAIASDSNQTYGGQVFNIALTLCQVLPGTQRVAQVDIYRKVYPRNR